MAPTIPPTNPTISPLFYILKSLEDRLESDYIPIQTIWSNCLNILEQDYYSSTPPSIVLGKIVESGFNFNTIVSKINGDLTEIQGIIENMGYSANLWNDVSVDKQILPPAGTISLSDMRSLSDQLNELQKNVVQGSFNLENAREALQEILDSSSYLVDAYMKEYLNNILNFKQTLDSMNGLSRELNSFVNQLLEYYSTTTTTTEPPVIIISTTKKPHHKCCPIMFLCCIFGA